MYVIKCTVNPPIITIGEEFELCVTLNEPAHFHADGITAWVMVECEGAEDTLNPTPTHVPVGFNETFGKIRIKTHAVENFARKIDFAARIGMSRAGHATLVINSIDNDPSRKILSTPIPSSQ